MIAGIAPTGSIYRDFTTIAASFTDAVGVDTASVAVYLDGTRLDGCAVSASGVSCPVSGLEHGGHLFAVLAADTLGFGTFASEIFDYGYCSGSAPPVSLTVQNIYWGSYTDYAARRLSVDYILGNGAVYPVDVTFEGAYASHGAALSGYPSGPQHVTGNSTARAVFTYSVPGGVTTFWTIVYASAEDACGESYDYPGGLNSN